MDANEQSKFFRQFKIVKILQMIILIIIEAAFFVILITDSSFRNSIFSNRHLFTLCAIMWFLMLFSFVCIFFDFSKMEHATKNTHYLSKLAYLDDMTGIPNRYSCDLIFKTYCNRENLSSIGCGMMEISNLKQINTHHGYEAGDTVIQDFCTILDEVGTGFGFVGRNSGNEYLAVFEICDKEKMEQFFSVLLDRIHLYNQAKEHIAIELSYAYVLNSDLHASRFSDIITLAYKKLHHLV